MDPAPEDTSRLPRYAGEAMPKTPDELKEQIEQQNEEPPAVPGHERTAEGLEVDPPSREDFFTNLEKVSRPKQ